MKSAATMGRRFSQDIIGAVSNALTLRKLTVNEAAKQVHMSKDYLYRRLRGERPFTVTDLEKISDALNIDIYDLITDAARIGNPNAATISDDQRRTVAAQLRDIASQLDPQGQPTVILDPSDPAFDPEQLTDEQRKTIMLNAIRAGVALAANRDDHLQDEIEHGAERY